MILLVSLLTAGLFGSGDFCGGLAAKRISPLLVVAGSHPIGLLGVLALALVSDGELTRETFLLGAIGGVFGGIGVGLLYRRLAIGPMHVVAPLTAITSATVPALWGAIGGERLGPAAWFGVALGLTAIGLASMPGADRPDGTTTGSDSRSMAPAPVDARAIIESLLAGAGFGTFFIFLDSTDSAAGPWPIVGARLATSTLVLLVVLIWARFVGPIPISGGWTIGLVAAAGLLDVGANIGFLWATTRGQLVVVSVLTSLYPLATVGLARVFLHERASKAQATGLSLAIGATVLIALG